MCYFPYTSTVLQAQSRRLCERAYSGVSGLEAGRAVVGLGARSAGRSVSAALAERSRRARGVGYATLQSPLTGSPPGLVVRLC